MQIIAHRGCPTLFLENTRNSFLKAIELNYDMIELDVQITKDNQLVVFHDDNLERLTLSQSTKKINDLNYEELLNTPLLDGSIIPLLKDILDEMDQQIAFNLEIKTTSVGIQLSDMIKDRKPYAPYLISSFLMMELNAFKTRNPNIPLAWLTPQLCLNDFKIAKKLNAISIHIPNESKDITLLKKMKEENYLCNVYTVNEIQDYHFWKQQNINGIFTDSTIILGNHLAT